MKRMVDGFFFFKKIWPNNNAANVFLILINLSKYSLYYKTTFR